MKIMAIDYGDAHTGIAVSDALLTLAGFFFPFLLFILVLAIIHDSADRRLSLRSNFNQIQMMLGSKLEGTGKWHDAQLLPIDSINADFPSADLFIDPQFIFCYDDHLHRIWISTIPALTSK